jgi:hypothetical protein
VQHLLGNKYAAKPSLRARSTTFSTIGSSEELKAVGDHLLQCLTHMTPLRAQPVEQQVK